MFLNIVVYGILSVSAGNNSNQINLSFFKISFQQVKLNKIFLIVKKINFKLNYIEASYRRNN